MSEVETVEEVPTKRCSKCGETKAVGEFYKKGEGKYYLPCKECQCAEKRAQSAANRAGWGLPPIEPTTKIVVGDDGNEVPFVTPVIEETVLIPYAPERITPIARGGQSAHRSP